MIPIGESGSSRDTLLRGVGVIFVAAFLFGSMAVFVRLAAGMPAGQIAFFRFAASFLLLAGLTRGRGLRPRNGLRPALFLRGALGGFSILLYYFGIERAGAGFATLLHCTYPISTALLAATITGEAFTARLGVALALNLAGVAFVLGPAASMDTSAFVGGLSALAASVLAGGAVTTARYLRSTEGASLITTYFMAVGAVVTAPFLLFGLPPYSSHLAMALAGVILTSVTGQWLLHQGLGYTSAAQGSLTAATGVVTAAGLEALVFDEIPGSNVLVGGLLMLTAVGLAVGRASPGRSLGLVPEAKGRVS